MLLQDIRYAWRSLTKSRGFTAIAVACLALGIGINITIFSVVDGVMLRPYPYQDAGSIVVLNGRNQRMRRQSWRHLVLGLQGSPRPDKTLDSRWPRSAGAASPSRTARPSPTRYAGSTVTWNLFELLGTPPISGRNFGPDDDRPGAEPVVLLSHEVWQTRYGGDRSMVGRAIQHQRPASHGHRRDAAAIRISRNTATLGAARAIRARSSVATRARPGVRADEAGTRRSTRCRATLTSVARRLAAAYPTENRDWSAGARPLSDWMLPG